MIWFHEQDLTEARFQRVSLRGASFTQVSLNDASMHTVDLTVVQIRGACFNEGRMRGVELVGVEISGALQNVVVNGGDIEPLVDAELNRRMPERSGCARRQRGVREAWANVAGDGEGTLARAKTLTEAALHRSVDEEWLFHPDSTTSQLRQR